MNTIAESLDERRKKLKETKQCQDERDTN